MKKVITFLLIISYSLLSYAQFSVGPNQTICLGDTAQVIATLSGPGTSSCNGVVDSLVGPTAGGNGSNGNSFNIINTSGSDLTITGFSQGGTYVNAAAPMEIWMYPGDYIPVAGTTTGWMLVGSATVALINGGYSTMIPVTGVTIPAGATYGFRIGSTASIAYATTTGLPGVTPWFSNSMLTVTEGHGGSSPLFNSFIPRGWNGIVHYGGGASWYDINSGQMIGSGDTLNYSPTQTTFVAAINSCNGQNYADTMRINVLNTQITSSGLSLCNGPITLTAASGFALYVWNNNSASPQMLATSSGTYYVNCTSTNGSVCQSPPITIYGDTVPVAVTPPDTTLVCPGDTVYLQAPLGYSSYMWNTGATAQSILADSTGSYWFYAMDANGCIASSDTAQIVTNELHPNIWSDVLSLCSGGPLIFLNRIYTDPIYLNYQWGTNTTLAPSVSSTQVGTQAGNYWVTVTDQFGCSGTSDTITIYSGNFTFNLLPADSVFLCNAGSNVTLDAGNVGSNLQITYLWNTGATTPTITTNIPGSYYCVATMPQGCYGFSDTIEVFGINPQLTYSGLSLCSGPISLNTANYDIYQWSNSATTQSLTVNTAGDYYVFVTDSNGCTAYSDTISIYTNAFQYNIVPSGSTTICAGYTVDLDAGNQFTGHLWNTGASTSTITASTTGQYYASMTDINGCSGYTDTVDVTNMSVNLTTTGYSLCNPQAYPTLNAGSGYYLYNWNTGDTISSITATVPGNYYVTVIDENGCTASSDTITIYLNQFAFNVNAIGTDSICQPSGQVTLDAGTGYFSYQWSSGGNTQQTTVNAAGNYTVSVTDMNGCSGLSTPFTVHNIVSTSTITGLSNVMQNTVENYVVTLNATSTYNWGVTAGILQTGLGTNSVDVLWNTPGQGSIYVIETDANGCIGDTISLAVTIFQSTDINENQITNISIYPNPFTKSALISITNIISNYQLTLYDITGKKILVQEDLNKSTYELKRGIFSKGIYFLEIKTEENKWIRKVIIN
jgi:hypothetical protein